MSYPKSQYTIMKFDPCSGEQKPYPSHAWQYREYHGQDAWLFDPWTGKRRDSRDIGTDVLGNAIKLKQER